MEAVKILWSPARATMPNLGALALLDTTDGDTPNLRMPVRMLSVDTPEVTARTPEGARRVDDRLAHLADRLQNQDDLPVSRRFADYLRPKLATGQAGTLQFTQGQDASAFAKQNATDRLTKPDAQMRRLFVRIADSPFDDNNRLLAYLAPNYTEQERQVLDRRARSTFNLDLVRAGWAAPFVIYPAIPGELDLPLLLEAGLEATAAGRGIWANQNTLLAYEYRMAEKLASIVEAIVAGRPPRDRYRWRSRYCIDMRDRVIHGPEDYIDIPSVYRLWVWPDDVSDAVSRLNLSPAPRLVGLDQ